MERRIPPPRKPAPAQRTEPVLLAQPAVVTHQQPPQQPRHHASVTAETLQLMARLKAQPRA